MAYDLNTLATRSRPFRVIKPSATLEGELLRIYTPILTRWRTTASTMLALYATSNGDPVTEADNSDKEIAIFLALMALRFTDLFGRVETWHRTKWIANVKAATEVDATWMTMPLSDTTKQSVSSALVQARSLSDEARNRIVNAVVAGQRTGASAEDVARDINKGLALGRKRAGRIAENELDNVVKALTDARMAEAGITQAVWRHFTPRERARPHHLAREGNRYASDDPVWSELFAPYCRCQKRPVLSVTGSNTQPPR